MGILVVFSFVLVNCSKKEKVIKIGAILPLTGPAGYYGQEAKKVLI